MCAQIGKFDDILIPVPPALPLKSKIIGSETDLVQLSSPLMKVKKEEEGIAAIRSGRRSVIVPFGNKIYRLKGCGNDDEGFIL